jgi:hypothetical protein
MSDENENENEGAPVLPVPETEPSPYLTRSTMLPVEGVIYCLTHTVVHEDTVNPYGEGPESWCTKEEHRSVYYRGHKGDIDERQPADGSGTVKRRIVTANSAGLSPAESALVLRLTRTLHNTLAETRKTLDQILGKDPDEDGRASDPLLGLTNSILSKLGDGDGDGVRDG